MISHGGRNNRWTVHVLTHGLAPDARTKLIQALNNVQLLVYQGNYCIKDTLHTLWCSLQSTCGLRVCPIFVHETIWHSAGGIEWCKQYLTPSVMLLVQEVYKCLAHPKPYLVHHTKTSRPTRNPTFCCFQCLIQPGPILNHPGGLRHTLFPAKFAICCRRVLGCHPL